MLDSEASLPADDPGPAAGHGTAAPAPPWPALLRALPHVGPLRLRTRGLHAWMEQAGACRSAWVEAGAGVLLAPGIDARLRLDRWQAAAILPPEAGAPAAGLGVRDDQGRTVLELHPTMDTDPAGWAGLLARHGAPATAAADPPPQRPAPPRHPPVDMAGLRVAWASLGDAAELTELFARRGLTRLQGLRLGGARLAWRVDHALLRLLLETLADWILDVEVSVSNAAATQVHAGPVYQIREAGPWLEIRDEGFRFRICEAAVREAWVVRVPTPRGTMLALELFDSCERPIARMAGPPGGGGADWRRILHALPLVEA